MSLFEWICESYNPGAVGDVTAHDNQRERTRLGAIFTGLLSLGILAFPFYVLYREIGFQFGPFCVLFVGLAGYLLVSYFVRPNPDTSNIGWCGGLIDNPFRISDDFNRFLIFLAIALIPGRLLAIGIVDLIQAFTTPTQS